MKDRTQFHCWRRRSIRLLAELATLCRSCGDDGGEEELHRLRVALRRVRLYLRLARPWLASAVMREFRPWASSLAETTGRVRDFDVALAWLKGRESVSGVRELLARQRSRLWAKSRARLSPPPIATAEALTGLVGSRERTKQFAKRLRKRKTALKAEVARQLPDFPGLAPAARHEFRRALRRWRYLRELTIPRRKHADDRFLNLLIHAQEAIGEERNRLVTEGLVQRLRGCRQGPGLRARLARERVQWAARANAALKGISKRLGSSEDL